MQGRLSIGFAATFYAVLAAFAWGACYLAGIDVLVWYEQPATGPGLDASIGAVFGLLVVVASAVLERTAGWAKRLSAAFADLLGPLTLFEAFALAVFSSIGEELVFRGFLMQWLASSEWVGEGVGPLFGLVISSLVFGGVHIGPDLKTFWPWTVMALVLGFALGGMYWYTGSVLAPVVAHFTINFLNLSLIAQHAREGDN